MTLLILFILEFMSPIFMHFQVPLTKEEKKKLLFNRIEMDFLKRVNLPFSKLSQDKICLQ